MIPQPTSKSVGQQYGWGDGCEGWHLVRAQNLSVIEERMPPGTAEQRHWHARARQFFYVLEGTLTLEVEGETHHLAARSGIELPPGATEQRHWHARARQFFYVLEGTLTLEVEGETHRLAARTGIELPPGTAHQASNDSTSDVQFLVISEPPSHGDRHETDVMR